MRRTRAGLRLAVVPALLIVMLLSSCASEPRRGPDQAPPARATEDPSIVSLRGTLAEGARSVVGKKELVVRGRRFTMDCTGVVLAVYWYAGIDLAQDFGKYGGGGVTRIYRTLEGEGLLYDSSHPLVGDVIFWDNTYDRDGDGKWDDALTHVGMVTAVSDDGTVAYVHFNVHTGIVIEHMNLPHPPQWLAGQLYRILGMGYLLSMGGS
ncbi:MAG: CHAP domain-containing protein [Spirochaetes bacterium]|nr:CHAP domain-containing protein [Spirochaetota bacterium]